TFLPARSVTDLISGRAITTATRRSAGSPSSCAAAKSATVIRSATSVAAATCSCRVLLLEFEERTTVDCPIVPESAAASLFGLTSVFNEGGGSRTRVAAGSVFALMLAGFVFLGMEREALSRPRRGGGPVLEKQANWLLSAHGTVPAWCGG